jgi:hypothetical protein
VTGRSPVTGDSNLLAQGIRYTKREEKRAEDKMKKKIVLFTSQCAIAELDLEVVDLAEGDRTKILEELEGYTIISMNAKTIRAYKRERFEVLRAELSKLMKKGWAWSD